MAYADPAHPGYLRSDLNQKAVFTQGVDQTYYSRPVDRIMKELPLSTCADAITLIQQYTLDRAPVTGLVSRDYQYKAMVVAADASAAATDGHGRAILRAYDPTSGF